MASFQQISGLLHGVKDRVKDGSAMEAAYLVEVANQVLRNVYEEEVWDMARVLYFKQGVLTVGVQASVVGHVVKMGERKFCEAVRRQTGVGVKSLVCRVGENKK